MNEYVTTSDLRELLIRIAEDVHGAIGEGVLDTPEDVAQLIAGAIDAQAGKL